MADVVALGRGVYRVADGTRQRLAYAAGPPEARWVFLDGRVWVLDIRNGGAVDASHVVSGLPRTGDAHGGRAQDDEMALAAPMPATVAAISVEPGQQVEAGDLLLMLEAMKMELPIRAPRAGRVVAVACRPGELVQPGIPLVKFE